MSLLWVKSNWVFANHPFGVGVSANKPTTSRWSSQRPLKIPISLLSTSAAGEWYLVTAPAAPVLINGKGETTNIVDVAWQTPTVPRSGVSSLEAYVTESSCEKTLNGWLLFPIFYYVLRLQSSGHLEDSRKMRA